MTIEPAGDKYVSVIIPAWNGGAHLPACLDALLNQEYGGYEVIVVDNASIDGSVDLVASRYPAVRLIRADSNLGFAGACNRGLSIARGQLLVLLNQDTCVSRGWLQALAAAFGRSNVGVAGCKILYPDGRTIQHAGGWIEWPLALARHTGHGEHDVGQWDESRQVEYVTGAAIAFRRDVLDYVGLLDEGFWPGYFEDADFCYRARQAGYEVWYIADAVLTHKESTSLTDTVLRSRAYHRGRLRFLLKHLSPQRFVDEFLPAERASQLELGGGHAANLLRCAYLEAIAVAAVVLPRRWQVDAEEIDRVLVALQQLVFYQSTVTSLVSSLQEIVFRSSIPVIGPLIALVRSTWYSVAARWAVRHLMQQQEVINQLHDVYVHAVISLSREIARLNGRLVLGEEKEMVVGADEDG